jgi:hypothetical protein
MHFLFEYGLEINIGKATIARFFQSSAWFSKEERPKGTWSCRPFCPHYFLHFRKSTDFKVTEEYAQ